MKEKIKKVNEMKARLLAKKGKFPLLVGGYNYIIFDTFEDLCNYVINEEVV